MTMIHHHSNRMIQHNSNKNKRRKNYKNRIRVKKRKTIIINDKKSIIKTNDKKNHVKNLCHHQQQQQQQQQQNQHFYDNGCNLSNYVPTQNVLRSILHPSFPILFLPEYIKRRCTVEKIECYNNNNNNNNKSILTSSSSSLSTTFELPQAINDQYQKYISNRKYNLDFMKRYSSRHKGRIQTSNDDDQHNNINNDNSHDNNNNNNNNNDDYDDDDVSRLVRAIIIPLSSTLISKVAYPTSSMTTKITIDENIRMDDDTMISNDQNTNKNQHENHENKSTMKTTTTATTTTTTTNSEQNPSIHNNHPIMNNMVMNRYKQNKSPPKLFQTNESIISIVDGVISTLVHKRHKYKQWNDEEKNNKSSSNGKKRSYNHLLKRRKKCSSPLSYNNLCYGRNVLSEGYNVASSDDLGYSYPSNSGNYMNISTSVTSDSSTQQPLSKRRKVAHCMNMMPGIQCTHLNSCASYARCSSIMRKVHNLIGDNLMRELLMDSIVLIPVGRLKHNNDDSNDEGRSAKGINHIDDGNYFQLCGPSLSLMNTYARPDQFKKEVIESLTSLSSHEKMRTDIHCNEKTSNAISSKVTGTEWVVPRHKIFYSESYIPKVGLPPSHILNQYDAHNDKNNDIEMKMLDDIVQLQCSVKGNKCRRKRWKRLKNNGIVLCKEILLRHKKCDYARLLERYCPLPELIHKQSSNTKQAFTESPDILTNIAKCFTDIEGVISFLRSVLTKVFPTLFWGSQHNLNIVLSVMKSFVKLRRYERLPLKYMTKGIRVLDLHWLFHSSLDSNTASKISKSDHEAATHLMNNQIKWLYCKFLIPLIRSTFYVTDTEFTGKQIVYYRKPVWSKLRSIAMDQLLRKQYQVISRNEAMKNYAHLPMGFSRLRLLPKETGIRPIIISSRNEDLEIVQNTIVPERLKYVNTNVALRPISDVLKYEYSLDPTQFGIGVIGFDRVYNKMKVFSQELKNISDSLSTKSANGVPLYFCSVDIKKCYDNINQEYLYNIMKNVIKEDEYHVHHNTILHHGTRNTKLHRKHSRTTGKADILSTLMLESENISRHFCGAIVLDNAKSQHLSKESLLELLRNHLQGNIVVSRQKYGHSYLAQKSGIPQGSVLSTTFCNYYFGDSNIENVILKGLSNNSNHISLLVRVVDDFLFVTTDKNARQQFMKNMFIGIPNLGVKINEDKSRVNHDTTVSITTPSGSKCIHSVKSSLMKKGNDSYFPWCGLLINTETFSLHVDYSRFTGTTSSDTLTLDRDRNALRKRMRTFVRPRCQKLFFDTTINSELDIQINFHQALSYAAIKSVNYIMQGLDGGIRQNQRYVFSCVISLIKYTHGLIHSRLLSKNDEIASKSSIVIEQNDALWLGSHAFETIYRRAGNQDFRDISKSLQIFRKNLKTKAQSKTLNVSASTAMKKFDIDSFHFGHLQSNG